MQGRSRRRGRAAAADKEVEHGQAQGAGTYGAQGYKHAEHCTEHHSDRTRVAGSRWVVGAGQGVVADAAAHE